MAWERAEEDAAGTSRARRNIAAIPTEKFFITSTMGLPARRCRRQRMEESEWACRTRKSGRWLPTFAAWRRRLPRQRREMQRVGRHSSTAAQPAEPATWLVAKARDWVQISVTRAHPGPSNILR